MAEPLAIRTVDASEDPGAGLALLGELRQQLSPRGDVVSERGRQRTIEVFGEPLSPRAVVQRICDEVAGQGIDAALRYSAKLDGAEHSPETVRVSPAELEAAHEQAAPDYLAMIRRVRDDILAFQTAVLPTPVRLERPGRVLEMAYVPLGRVGVCVPGGAAAYPSTLLMCAVPAQAAGVEEIAVVAPPTPFGANNPDLLAACWEIGVREIYRLGGAQAVACLAYGAGPIEQVDKIVGPGNLFVALAKQYVSETVGIDMMAGPTEVLILADETADPRFVAADLISQAEHAPGASILVTWSAELIEAVKRSAEEQLGQLARSAEARESLTTYGALIRVADEAAGCAISDAIAPEHLQVETADPRATLGRLRNAGAVFLGHQTPVALGDYVAGPSHTLPTGGSARFASGLSALDFRRRMSVIEYDLSGVAKQADDLRRLAETEGLTAHAHSVDVRLETLP